MTSIVKREKHIKHLPARDRPRERLKILGIEGLTTVELLVLIIGSGSVNHPLLGTCVRLLKIYPPQKLSNISLSELTKLPGIGDIGASKILASIELGKRISHPPDLITMDNPTKVVQMVNEIRNKKREYAVALYLNGRQELIKKQTISIGGLNFNMLEARDLFGPALGLPCAFVILVHNHPSGNTVASDNDIVVTERLRQAGLLLGVQLLDHIIVGGHGYFSFREGGLL